MLPRWTWIAPRASLASFLADRWYHREDPWSFDHKESSSFSVASSSSSSTTTSSPYTLYTPQRRLLLHSLGQSFDSHSGVPVRQSSSMLQQLLLQGLLLRNHAMQCEPAQSTPEEEVQDGQDNSFPNFTRHGSESLLAKYLTREVYEQLKDRKTARGVTLEDTIRAGVMLPGGANPPRGIAGVYAGDAESYQVFRPLFDPLIVERHHVDSQRQKTKNKAVVGQGHRMLQRHRTNLNPQFLVQQRLDPEGEYVLYTRMRLARSLVGFRFSPCISRQERRQIERILRDCCGDWNEGSYLPVMKMSNEMHNDLIQRRILFPDPDDFALSAGTHRDWPDARGLYCSSWDGVPAVSLWVNFEDHVSVVSTAKGGDVQHVFWQLSKAVWALETALHTRGHKFVEDPRLGFLNASPANIGTALRASVYVKLVLLGQQPGFEALVRRLRLIPRSDYPQTDRRYTGIFDIANAEALGKTEVELINIMIKGVAKLIALEKRLENGEEVNLDEEESS